MKRAVKIIKDSFSTNKKLLAGLIIVLCVSMYETIDSSLKTMSYYYGTPCVLDIIIDTQFYNNMIMLCIPLIVLYVVRCKKNCLYMQSIVRHKTRSSILKEQIIESFIYATIFTSFLMITQILVAIIRKVVFLNWSETASVYYHVTGNVSTQNVSMIILVIVEIFLLYISKFMVLFVFVDVLQWYPKYIFLIFILLMMPLALLFTTGKDIFYVGLSVDWNSITEPMTIWKYFFVVICIFSEYQIGKMIIKGKDIFR